MPACTLGACRAAQTENSGPVVAGGVGGQPGAAALRGLLGLPACRGGRWFAASTSATAAARSPADSWAKASW